MADRHLAFHGIKHLVIKYLCNKAHILMITDHAAIVDCNPTAFLSPVLQGKQSVVGSVSRCQAAVAIYTEDTAFLMQAFRCKMIQR